MEHRICRIASGGWFTTQEDEDDTTPNADGSPVAAGGDDQSRPGPGEQAWDVAADFNNDGFAELAAAAPSESVGSIYSAGAVSVLPGSAGGLTATRGRLFTQDSAGVPDVAESGDSFGGTAFIAG